jgi:hypothetical protein
MAYYHKKYLYKVYNGATYVRSWSSEVLSDPNFRITINGGSGELIVRLSRNYDNFGEEVDVKLNNRVELWLYDREQINGVLLYQGFVSGYRPVLEGTREYLEITCLSYIYELSMFMLRDNSGDTQLEYVDQDPSDILKSIIDNYRLDGGTLNYTASSIDTTGTTCIYTFNSNTVREAVDKIIELCPENWYWYIDPNSIIYLKPKPATADHNFIIGKHLNSMETWRRSEDIVNRIYFKGGGDPPMYRVYSNSASIIAYGLHCLQKVDGRVTVIETADTICNNIIEAKKDPEIRTRITLLDTNGEDINKGYDIESIQPGETCKLLNIKGDVKTYSIWDSSKWDTNVWDQTLATTAADVTQIMSVEYTPDSMVIEASSRTPEIGKRIEDIYRNMIQDQTVDVPATPTA